MQRTCCVCIGAQLCVCILNGWPNVGGANVGAKGARRTYYTHCKSSYVLRVCSAHQQYSHFGMDVGSTSHTQPSIKVCCRGTVTGCKDVHILLGLLNSCFTWPCKSCGVIYLRLPEVCIVSRLGQSFVSALCMKQTLICLTTSLDTSMCRPVISAYLSSGCQQLEGIMLCWASGVHVKQQPLEIAAVTA